MDPTRTVGATEGTRDVGRTDGQTDGRNETNIPSNNFVVQGYNNVTAMSYPASLVKQYKISIELSR